jgi:hypothetical protein
VGGVEGRVAGGRAGDDRCGGARGLIGLRVGLPPPPRFARSPSPALRGRISDDGGCADPPPLAGEGDHAQHGGGGAGAHPVGSCDELPAGIGR